MIFSNIMTLRYILFSVLYRIGNVNEMIIIQSFVAGLFFPSAIDEFNGKCRIILYGARNHHQAVRLLKNDVTSNQEILNQKCILVNTSFLSRGRNTVPESSTNKVGRTRILHPIASIGKTGEIISEPFAMTDLYTLYEITCNEACVKYIDTMESTEYDYRNLLFVKILTSLKTMFTSTDPSDTSVEDTKFVEMNEILRKRFDKKISHLSDDSDLNDYVEYISEYTELTDLSPWMNLYFFIQRFRVGMLFFNKEVQSVVDDMTILGNLVYDGECHPGIIIDSIKNYKVPLELLKGMRRHNLQLCNVQEKEVFEVEIIATTEEKRKGSVTDILFLGVKRFVYLF